MSTQALPLPLDVRLMNACASLLFVAFGAAAFAAAAWWAVRHPMFTLTRITVEGDVAHTSVATLRANVAPRMTGNFFTADLAIARQAFRQVPWVRDAVVRREFPNRLRVVLQEHRAVAFWGAESETALVNSFGEVFDANPGDVEGEDLPRLTGPIDQSAAVLAMYRAIAPLIQAVDLDIETLALTARGSWQATLDTGAVIELGRGTHDEVVARARRFADTITQAASQYGRRPEAVQAADLRHPDGYAIRLRGVSTVPAEPKKK